MTDISKYECTVFIYRFLNLIELFLKFDVRRILQLDQITASKPREYLINHLLSFLMHIPECPTAILLHSILSSWSSTNWWFLLHVRAKWASILLCFRQLIDAVVHGDYYGDAVWLSNMIQLFLSAMTTALYALLFRRRRLRRCWFCTFRRTIWIVMVSSLRTSLLSFIWRLWRCLLCFK